MFASKIYLNESYDLNKAFVENSTSNYGLRVEKVGFRYPTTAAKFINNWVRFKH
jgi:serine protease inhibitor